MKAKLTKITGIYTLLDDNDRMVASDDVDMQKDYEIGKLSTKNCDEIFGVVDVEKLAYQSTEEVLPHHGDYRFKNVYEEYFRDGFNKAIELNKDNVFTLEDMGNLWDFCTYNKGTFAEFIQSIQQPTEIEVEIEQVNKLNIDKGIFEWMPKLDDNGCLTLTKRI